MEIAPLAEAVGVTLRLPATRPNPDQRCGSRGSGPRTSRAPRRRSSRPSTAPAGRRRAAASSLRAAAAVADGLQLVHELRVGEKLRHDAEGQAPEVLIEPGRDHPDAAVGQRERRTHDRVVEELHLVDADHVVPASSGRRAPQTRSPAPPTCVLPRGRRRRVVVTVVDARLEDDHPLAGDLGPAQPPDHLLALAGEHRPADTSSQPPCWGGMRITGRTLELARTNRPTYRSTVFPLRSAGEELVAGWRVPLRSGWPRSA